MTIRLRETGVKCPEVWHTKLFMWKDSYTSLIEQVGFFFFDEGQKFRVRIK